jgi:hypothetical protein
MNMMRACIQNSEQESKKKHGIRINMMFAQTENTTFSHISFRKQKKEALQTKKKPEGSFSLPQIFFFLVFGYFSAIKVDDCGFNLNYI